MNGWWRRKRGYFEGWYQKISSLEKTYTAVFIYGIAHHHNRKHGFVQWASTSHKGGYKEFPIETVTFNREKHLFESPDLVARKQFLKASLGELEVDLQFDYSNTIRKNSMVSNVMGPNQLVPFLPCYIAVEEPNTPVEGTLSSTNRSQKFIGISYTEKSWGHTFPKDYCWMHTTSPEEGIELLLAVADVPVSVWNHQTSIGYLKLDNTIISLARHKGARVEPGAAGQLIMYKGETTITIHVNGGSPSVFRSPVKGKMEGSIKQYLDCFFTVKVTVGKTMKEYHPKGCFEAEGKYRTYLGE